MDLVNKLKVSKGVGGGRGVQTPPPTLDIRMTLVLNCYRWIICCICHKTQPTKFGSGFLHSQITFKTERHIQLYDEGSLKEGPKKKHDRTERT